MTRCACPASTLTSVAFASGVAMQRCPSHELQSWTVDGRPTDARTARRLLQALFVESRGQRRSGAPASRRTIPPAQPAAPARHSDEDLTALLNARGLPGTWSVA